MNWIEPGSSCEAAWKWASGCRAKSCQDTWHWRACVRYNGDPDGMMESWRQLDMRWPDIKYCTQAMRVYFQLKTHTQDPAARKQALAWAEANQPETGPDIIIPGIGPAWNDEADYAVYAAWARVQLLLGQPARTMDVIRPMLETADLHGLIHRAIELSLLQAQALFVMGKKDASRQLLGDAIAHAERNGYLRLLDQDPILVRMLHEPGIQELSPGYIRKVLEIHGGACDAAILPSSINSHSDIDVLIEPLSSREKEVLKLMAEGLSNPEIAARLFLSPNTLKAHTQHIFGKLGVHNRVQAINKSRELKIV